VFDAHGPYLGALKRILGRGDVLRAGHVRPDEVPPPPSSRTLEVEAPGHLSATGLHSGYFIPRTAVLRIRAGDIELAGTRADLENLRWDRRPGSLRW
jgi:hypothetical protein